MLKAAVLTGTVLLTGVGALSTGAFDRLGASSDGGAFARGSGGAAGEAAPAEEGTLWGIYGHHGVHDCPLNNREIARYVHEASKMDLTALYEKYGVVAIHDRYHSGLEHTFLWAVETTRPRDLESFAVELGLAGWNDLTIVPLVTFEDGVVPMVSRVHGFGG